MTPEVEQLRAAPEGLRAGVLRKLAAAVGDAAGPMARNEKTRDLRWVLLAVIEETARHAGHADIIGEQIDGQTGILPARVPGRARAAPHHFFKSSSLKFRCQAALVVLVTAVWLFKSGVV